MKLPNPQQEKILALHRGQDWVCSTEYEFIRDHRKRISELNNGYLLERGYQLVAKKCDGRCGKKHSSMVAMRRAETIRPLTEQEENLKHAAQLCREFDNMAV